MADRYVSVTEAARILRVSKETVRRRIREGEVEFRTIERAQGIRYEVRLPDTLPGAEIAVSPAQLEVAVLRAQKESLEAQLAAQERAFQAALGALERQLDERGAAVRQLTETNHLLLTARLLPPGREREVVEAESSTSHADYLTGSPTGRSQDATSRHTEVVKPRHRGRWWRRLLGGRSEEGEG